MQGALIAVAAVLGLAIGSFLNVVIWRVPRNLSVLRPRSRCPACETPISPIDNVPLVSWLRLGGKCRHCAAPISIRYPLVEVGCAVLFGAAGARFGWTWELPAYLVLFAALLTISVIDLEHSSVRTGAGFIPWRPFLALGTVVAVLWGEPILRWFTEDY